MILLPADAVEQVNAFMLTLVVFYSFAFDPIPEIMNDCYC